MEDSIKAYIDNAINEAMNKNTINHSCHPRSVFTDDLLEELINQTKTTLRILEKTKSKDGSMAQNCFNEGVNYVDFRRRVISKTRYEYKPTLEFIDKQVTGEELLMMEIFNKEDPTEVYVYAKNIDDYLQWAFEQIPERTAEMIKERYFNEKTFKEIADSYGITPERVRQIILKGLRMLRHPSRSGYVIWGDDSYSKFMRMNSEEFKQSSKELYLASDISILGLSVRAHNALLRAGVSTCRDFLDVSEEQLLKTRNIGKKNFREIMERKQKLKEEISK